MAAMVAHHLPLFRKDALGQASDNFAARIRSCALCQHVAALQAESCEEASVTMIETRNAIFFGGEAPVATFQETEGRDFLGDNPGNSQNPPNPPKFKVAQKLTHK